jgi:actin-related protein
MIGEEASKYRTMLELSQPTSEGIIKKWDDMELLLKYSLFEVCFFFNALLRNWDSSLRTPEKNTF